MIMTNFAGGSLPEDGPEADVAEQQIPVDVVDATLDTGYLDDRRDAEANQADLIDQAIEIPYADDDRPMGS
jgi:hypothetical protein